MRTSLGAITPPATGAVGLRPWSPGRAEEEGVSHLFSTLSYLSRSPRKGKSLPWVITEPWFLQPALENPL